MSDTTDQAPEPTRRDVLDTLLVAGGAIWAAGVVVPGAIFVWPARSGGPGEEYAKAGSTSDFPVGTARMVRKSGKPVMVLRVKDDDYRAFSAVCTHLACVVRWDEATKRIACPCHAGFFDTEGKVISGPPPRALTPYRVIIAGDEVRVY